MLTKFDDYPIHQTPDPIAVPASSDRDVYERYWFNGYTTDESLYFGAATAFYPHIGVRDAALSLIIDGVQTSFFVSAHATGDPTELEIGPWRLEIVEAMRSCRIMLGPNETGIQADLTFSGRTGCIEEARHQFMSGKRRAMDMTRFSQYGRWAGSIQIDDDRVELDAETTLGTKDRSWGLRPLAGGDPRPAPGQGRLAGLFFLWAPLHFGDHAVHYQLFEDHHGVAMYSVGAVLPQYESPAAIPGVVDPAVTRMRRNDYELGFEAGSRMLDSIGLSFAEPGRDDRHEITLAKITTFRMKGLGYGHPHWRHGTYHGELAMDRESWEVDALDPTKPENQHVQHFVRAHWGDRVGIGAVEQLFIGPHEPTGLTGIFDGPQDR